jgi:hypothetical protein
VAEALIGAAYLSKDKSVDAAISAMHVLHIPLQEVWTWGDVHKLARGSNGMANGRANGSFEPVLPARKNKAPSWMKAFRSAETNLLGWDFRDEQRARDVMVSVQLLVVELHWLMRRRVCPTTQSGKPFPKSTSSSATPFSTTVSALRFRA